MKKYFISFNYMMADGFSGFYNCVKTSLNAPSYEEIKKWEEEIQLMDTNKNKIKFINIMFFKEIK